MTRKQRSSNSPVSEGEQAERLEQHSRKQARREAKAMLAVEKARARLDESEAKMAKAQLRLEKRRTRLQVAEAQLDDLRHSFTPAGVAGAAEATDTASTAQTQASEGQDAKDDETDEASGRKFTWMHGDLVFDAKDGETDEASGSISEAGNDGGEIASIAPAGTEAENHASAALSEAANEEASPDEIPWWQRTTSAPVQHPQDVW